MLFIVLFVLVEFAFIGTLVLTFDDESRRNNDTTQNDTNEHSQHEYHSYDYSHPHWNFNWEYLITHLVNYTKARTPMTQEWMKNLLTHNSNSNTNSNSNINSNSNKNYRKNHNHMIARNYYREKIQSKHKIDSNNINTVNINSNTYNNNNKLRYSIEWNNPNYIGQCRPYLYPHIAFISRLDVIQLLGSNADDAELDVDAESLEEQLTDKIMNNNVTNSTFTQSSKLVKPDNDDSGGFSGVESRSDSRGYSVSGGSRTRDDDVDSSMAGDGIRSGDDENENSENEGEHENMFDYFKGNFDVFNNEMYSLLFNTSLIYNHSQRIEYFENRATRWRFGSVVVIADPIEEYQLTSMMRLIGNSKSNNNNNNNGIIDLKKTGYYQQIVSRIGSKSMVIEVTVTANMEIVYVKGLENAASKQKISQVNSIYNRFLCVFNDGSVVLSKIRRAGTVHFFVIECDITNNINLKYAIYTQTYQNLHANPNPNSDSNSYVNSYLNRNGLNFDDFTTNIGLTLFGLHPKKTRHDLINEYSVGMNIQLPVCGHIEINRKPKVYQTEYDYHFDTNSLQLPTKIHSSIRFEKSNSNSNSNSNGKMRDLNDKENLEFEHFVSAANAIHPRSRSGQMDTLTLQWLDYHIFQGFTHFYFYDHLYNRDKTDIEYFYNLLNNDNYEINYVKQGYVTFIQWPMIVRWGESPFYQFAAFLDSIRRFSMDTKYLWLGDVDEFIIPKPNRSTIQVQFEPPPPPKPKQQNQNQNQNQQKNESEPKNENQSSKTTKHNNSNERDHSRSQSQSQDQSGEQPAVSSDHSDDNDSSDSNEDNNSDSSTRGGAKNSEDEPCNVTNSCSQMGNQQGQTPPAPPPVAPVHFVQPSYDWHFSDVLFPNFVESEMITAVEIIKALLEEENENSKNNNNRMIRAKYDGIEMFNYPGLQSIYNLWHTANKVDPNNKELGCNKKDINNKFDTFIQRQSCLHYKVKTLNKIFIKPTTRAKAIYRYMTHRSKFKQNKFEVRPKLLLNPRTVLVSIHHEAQSSRGHLNHTVHLKKFDNSQSVSSSDDDNDNDDDIDQDDENEYANNYNNDDESDENNIHSSRAMVINTDGDGKYIVKNTGNLNFNLNFSESRKEIVRDVRYHRQYDMFMLHIRDHWNHLEKQKYLLNFESAHDMKIFYSITQSQCDFENIILYWNNRFLQSKYGLKWKDKLYVEPLVDKDGIFCYLKDPNYTNQWTNNIKLNVNGDIKQLAAAKSKRNSKNKRARAKQALQQMRQQRQNKQQ